MVTNSLCSVVYSFFSNNGFVVTGSVGLVSRFGQFYKAVDPGLAQVNVCTESLRVVDVKIQIISIGRQTVITRDNVNVEMYVPLVFFAQPFPSTTSLFFYSFYFWGDGLTQRTITTQRLCDLFPNRESVPRSVWYRRFTPGAPGARTDDPPSRRRRARRPICRH